MASDSEEVLSATNDEEDSPASNEVEPAEGEDAEVADLPASTTADDEQEDQPVDEETPEDVEAEGEDPSDTTPVVEPAEEEEDQPLTSPTVEPEEEKEPSLTSPAIEPEEEKEPSLTSPAVEPEEECHANEPVSTVSDLQEEPSDPIPSQEASKEDATIDQTQEPEPEPVPVKTRSVNFTPTADDTYVTEPRLTSSTNTHSSSSPSSYSSPSKSTRRPVDFIETLVESYKLETSNGMIPMSEEKKYVPKTTRTRLNPNWREHRTRRLMNKLEELSLWDREEEMKANQAQYLREQKWEQIQDRQRNHDLCLSLMRQRHESEMESAVVLDRGANGCNEENTNATIARAMTLASPANLLAYDLPTPPSTLKRRVKQQEENNLNLKTPIGRYRQFETNMDNKLDKLNQKLQPDREIMRAYSPYTSIPTSVVPLFSETYSALLAVPDTNPANKYNQYHYGVASYLHQPQSSSSSAPSSDYEPRSRPYVTRDMRVPSKEQAHDYSYYDDDHSNNYHRSNLTDDDSYSKYRPNLHDDEYYPSKYRSSLADDDYSSRYRPSRIDHDNNDDDDDFTRYRSTLSSSLAYSPPRRTTSLASATASSLYDYSTIPTTPREYSFLHSRPPISNSIHQRSLNDDLNAMARYSSETSRKHLPAHDDTPNGGSSAKNRLAAKHVTFTNQDDDDESLSYTNASRHYPPRPTYEPVEIISLSSTR